MPVSANGQGISEVLKSLIWIPFTDIAPAVYVPSHSDNGAAGLNAHREDVTYGELANAPPASRYYTAPNRWIPLLLCCFPKGYCITGEVNINTLFAAATDTSKSLKIERPQAGCLSVHEISWLRVLYGLRAKSLECLYLADITERFWKMGKGVDIL